MMEPESSSERLMEKMSLEGTLTYALEFQVKKRLEKSPKVLIKLEKRDSKGKSMETKSFYFLEEKIEESESSRNIISVFQKSKVKSKKIMKTTEYEEGEIPPSLTRSELQGILMNLENRVYTLNDAETFIKYRDIVRSLPAEDPLRETYEKIRENYIWNFSLLPILCGKERILIIKYLSKQNKPCSLSELKTVVKNICRVDDIDFDLALEDLLEKGFIALRKSLLREEYEITEKGKIAAILISERDEETLRGEEKL